MRGARWLLPSRRSSQLVGCMPASPLRPGRQPYTPPVFSLLGRPAPDTSLAPSLGRAPSLLSWGSPSPFSRFLFPLVSDFVSLGRERESKTEKEARTLRKLFSLLCSLGSQRRAFLVFPRLGRCGNGGVWLRIGSLGRRFGSPLSLTCSWPGGSLGPATMCST